MYGVAILSQVCGEYKTLPPTRFSLRFTIIIISILWRNTCLVYFTAPRMVASSMHLKTVCERKLFGNNYVQLYVDEWRYAENTAFTIKKSEPLFAHPCSRFAFRV